MSKSIHPMRLHSRGSADFGDAPAFFVWTSLRPAIPCRGALLRRPTPLHRLPNILHSAAGTVNHHLPGAGEFSTGVDSRLNRPRKVMQVSYFARRILFVASEGVDISPSINILPV